MRTRRLLVGILALLPSLTTAGTIDLTTQVHHNLGLSSLTLEGVTFSAQPDGYLQFTGYGLGVCQSSVGWSCNETEFPEALSITFTSPQTVTEIQVGYLQSQTPTWGPTYLPTQEIAVVVPSKGAPLYLGGVGMDGRLTAPVWLEGITGFRFFGLGLIPGVWGEGLMGAALAGVSFHPASLPPPVPPLLPPPDFYVPLIERPRPPQKPYGPNDCGCDPFEPPVTVPGPGPGILSLVGIGTWWAWRRRDRRWVETPWGDQEILFDGIGRVEDPGLVQQLRDLPPAEGKSSTTP